MVSVIDLVMGRFVLIFSRGFTLLMAHESVLEDHVVFIVAKIIHFNSSIADQFLYSPFKGVTIVG